MRGPVPRQRDAVAGFTLIEVLVALMITLAALTVLYGSVASILRTARTAAATREAISLARSRLESASDPARMLGEHAGDDGGGYRWRTAVSLAGTAPAGPATRPGPWARGTGLYAVSVTISWVESGAARSFTLRGAVLAPLPDAAP